MWSDYVSPGSRFYTKLMKVQGTSFLDLSVKCLKELSFALHWTTRGFLCGGRDAGCALCRVRSSRPMAYIATRLDNTIGLVEVGANTMEAIQRIADENNAGHLRGLRLRLRRSDRSQRLNVEYHGLSVVPSHEVVSDLLLLQSVARLYQLVELVQSESIDRYSQRLREQVLAQAETQAAMLSVSNTISTR